jgi:predicted flavoprotein YhiN
VLRDEIEAHGHATFHLDLLPDHSPERVLVEVRHPRGSRSLSSHLKSRLGLDGIKAGVLYEHLGKDGMNDPVALAHAIKALPITVVATRPLDEAISTAGGVAFEALDEHLMATAAPGVFCAGEMLDWEAPTGGYLLTASLASGVQAGREFWRFWALALDGKALIAIKNIAFDAGADDAPAPVPDGPIAGAVTSHLT